MRTGAVADTRWSLEGHSQKHPVDRILITPGTGAPRDDVANNKLSLPLRRLHGATSGIHHKLYGVS